MIIFDGCCGTKSVSNVFMRRGWAALTLDFDPQFAPDICMDIREFYPFQFPIQFDLMWFSPPCDEFAREFMPWCRTGKDPDLSIVKACLRIVSQAKPRFWVIENVIGAQRWLQPVLGPARWHSQSVYLWGFFPPLGGVSWEVRNKESLSSNDAIRRAMIPEALSEALAFQIENQPALF